MDYQLVKDKDLEAVKWLWSYCFESHEPFFNWYFSNYYQKENTLAGYLDNRLVSCLQLIPYQIFLRGQLLPTSYIIGLATYPEARQSGTIAGLLKAALEEMRRRGHYVNIMMPFNTGFYYKYQWGICYHHYKYLIPLADLKDLVVRWGDLHLITDGTEIPKLQNVYQKFTEDKHGYIFRQKKNWENILAEVWGEKGFVYLLEDSQGPKGYVIYVLRDNRVFLREMAYTSLQAQRALFLFLYGHRSQVEMLEWNAPLDDLTYFNLPDAKKDVKIFPFIMGRLVDVAKSLESVSYQDGVSKQIRIAVEDNLAPWNNQTFLLEVTEGRGRVESLGGQTGEIQCSVEAFSQLFFGRLSAFELNKMGKLQCTSWEQIRTLDKLFPKCNNYINEYL